MVVGELHAHTRNRRAFMRRLLVTIALSTAFLGLAACSAGSSGSNILPTGPTTQALSRGSFSGTNGSFSGTNGSFNSSGQAGSIGNGSVGTAY